MPLTAAQFYAFLGNRSHEIRWIPPSAAGATDGRLTLRLLVRKPQTGLEFWGEWTRAGGVYQDTILALAEDVKSDLTGLGAQ